MHVGFSRSANLGKMSFLNHSPMHHHPSTPGGSMDMLRNFWSDTDQALLGGCNCFVASGFHACPPSSLLYVPHIPDLEGENEVGMTWDSQASSAEFCMEDLLRSCITPDDELAAYHGDAPTSMMVSATPPQRSYIPEGLDTSQSNPGLAEYREASQNDQHAHGTSSITPVVEAPWSLDLLSCTSLFPSEHPPASGLSAQTITVPSSMELPKNSAREEGIATGPWPASIPLQSPMLNSVSNCKPGSLGGNVPTNWRERIMEMSGFVDLSNFLSPLVPSSGHLMMNAEQRANLGMERSFENTLELPIRTAQWQNMMAGRAYLSGTGELAKPRVNEEEKQGQFPGTFASARQDEVTGDHVQTHLTGRSFIAPPNPASFQATKFEQVHDTWKSANPGFNPDEETKRMPVNTLAPVTPEKQSKRRILPRKHKQKYEGASALPADHRMSNGEVGPFAPRKLQKLAPKVDQSSIVFSAPQDLLKAGDHVGRERRRRDLMNTRYQTLESLLPKLHSRRDRFGIVEDTKLYVKELQQRVSDLKRTRGHYRTQLEAAMVAKVGNEQLEEKKTANQGAAVPMDASQGSTSKSSQFFFCNAVCKVQQHVVKSGTFSSEKMIQEMVTTLRPSLMVEGSTKTQEAC